MEKEKGKNKFILVDNETYRDLESYMKYHGNKSVSEAAKSILRSGLQMFKYQLEARREGYTGLLKVGDPLEYGPLRYWLRTPPEGCNNEINEKKK
jgi:hypothetical protein